MRRFMGVAVVVLLGFGPVSVAHAAGDPSPTATGHESAAGSTPTETPSATPSQTPTTTPTTTPPSTPTPVPPKSTPTPAAVTPTPAWSITLDQPVASWEDKPTVFTGKISQ